MEALILDFREAYQRQDGYGVAVTLSPDLSKFDPPQWQLFEMSISKPMAVKDWFYRRVGDKSFIQLTKEEEIDCWSEVFSSYWSALAEMLVAKHGNRRHGDPNDWSRAYKAWKTMTDIIIRAFQSSVFPFWAVPCLYVAGRKIRHLALKADESARQKSGNITYNEDLQDDIIGSVGKNENLSDAARQVNRMFSACQADR
jgi:COP9 signalosome complex subunit 12